MVHTGDIPDIAPKLLTILLKIDSDDSSLEKSYVYANAQPLVMYDNADQDIPVYYYLHDRLDSVRLVIDEDAFVKNTYTYHPFGKDFAGSPFFFGASQLYLEISQQV